MFAVMSLASSTAPHTLNLEDPEPGPWSERLIRRAPQKLPPRLKQVGRPQISSTACEDQ